MMRLGGWILGLGWGSLMMMTWRSGRGGLGLSWRWRDLFVHHFGSRTFIGNGVDANRLLDENAAKFAAKWGNSVPARAQGGAAGVARAGRGFGRGAWWSDGGAGAFAGIGSQAEA